MIVIIGILAALVIVAYNGIQARAKNAQTIDVVAEYSKAARAYAADNGKYPEPAPGVTGVSCLGNGYPSASCADYTGAPSCAGYGVATEQTWFNDAVKQYLGNKTPTTNLQVVNCQGTPMIGGFYVTYPGTAYISYFLNGDTSCGSPGGIQTTRIPTDSSSTVCQQVLPTP